MLKRIAYALKSVGYALLVTVAILALVEVGLRLHKPEGPVKKFTLASSRNLEDHPLFGKIRRPGLSVERQVFGKRFVFRTNDLGLRGPPMSLEKPPGTYRIIFVGASVVENSHLPEDEIFPFLVERKLNERLGGEPHVEVGVLAKPGANSEVALAEIANMVLELHPDLVLVLSAGDWSKSLNPRYEPTLMYLAKRVRQEPSLTKVLERAVVKSRTVQLLQKAFANPKLSAHARRRSIPFKDPPDRLFERGLTRFQENLHRCGILTRDSGAAFALMTQVWLYKTKQPPEEDKAIFRSFVSRNIRAGGWNISPPVARKWVDRYNDVIRDVAHTDNFILVDTAKMVPNNLENMIDDVHLTAAGNRAFADAIVSELLRGGTLPRDGIHKQETAGNGSAP